MNIFFAVNDTYAEQLCVTLVSILENNPDTDFHFYILSRDFSEKSKAKIEKIKRHYGNAAFSYLYPDEKLFKNLKLNISYITMETYFRYVIADLVPDLDKCLYLDADIAVNGSLKKLWQIPLDGVYAAGVRDLFIERDKYKEKIGFDPADLYINAGVLLLNLEKIRQDGMVKKLFANTETMADKISYQDQDIINITFKEKIKELDSVYNFTAEHAKQEHGRHRRSYESKYRLEDIEQIKSFDAIDGNANHNGYDGTDHRHQTSDTNHLFF